MPDRVFKALFNGQSPKWSSVLKSLFNGQSSKWNKHVYVKSALKKRSDMFVQPSKIFVWGTTITLSYCA